jgi:hypothetical protein
LQDQGSLAKAACTKEPEEAIAVLTPPPMHEMTLYTPPNKSSSEQSSLKRKALGDSQIEQQSDLVAKAACIEEPEETNYVPPMHKMTLYIPPNKSSSKKLSLKRKALDHIGKLDKDSRIEQEPEPDEEAVVAWTPPIAMTKSTKSAKSTRSTRSTRSTKNEEKTVSGKTKMKPTHKKKKSMNKTTHSDGEKKPPPSDNSGFWSLREEQK